MEILMFLIDLSSINTPLYLSL